MTKDHEWKDRLGSFWTWFAQGVEVGRFKEFDDDSMLIELNSEVSQFPGLTWELGPGEKTEYALTISPDGDSALLGLSRALVEAAPSIQNWEFYSARRARGPAEVFTLVDESGAEVSIDASGWLYSLLRHPDGMVELIIEQGDLGLSEDRQYQAAVLAVDGAIGEERRLETICAVDGVVRLDERYRDKATKFSYLRQHLAQFEG